LKERKTSVPGKPFRGQGQNIFEWWQRPEERNYVVRIGRGKQFVIHWKFLGPLKKRGCSLEKEKELVWKRKGVAWSGH